MHIIYLQVKIQILYISIKFYDELPSLIIITHSILAQKIYSFYAKMFIFGRAIVL